MCTDLHPHTFAHTIFVHYSLTNIYKRTQRTGIGGKRQRNQKLGNQKLGMNIILSLGEINSYFL